MTVVTDENGKPIYTEEYGWGWDYSKEDLSPEILKNISSTINPIHAVYITLFSLFICTIVLLIKNKFFNKEKPTYNKIITEPKRIIEPIPDYTYSYENRREED